MATSLFLIPRLLQGFFELLFISLKETENRFIFVAKGLVDTFGNNAPTYIINQNFLSNIKNAYSLHMEILMKYEICAKSIINEKNSDLNNHNSIWIFHNSYCA